jgi:hypothetical protein
MARRGDGLSRSGRIWTFGCAIALTAPCLAEAECAWVLWAAPPGQVLPPSDPSPVLSPMAAFRTLDECQREKEKREVYTRCLPDTIDPRWPKGSNR